MVKIFKRGIKMLVSHESPISMLELSKKYNDYDYALVHLFDNYPQYFNFFKQSLKEGRIVYLDNSIFELGKSFNPERFAQYCYELGTINPDNFWYIVPDVLEDSLNTINNFKDFNYKIQGNSIGVAQGADLESFLHCFEFMKENADMVAISFDYSFYVTDSTKNKFVNCKLGRQKLIKFLDENNYLKDTKIHLLGCGLPQEFKAYKNIPEIISLDTSNPVVHALKGIMYTKDGLLTKDTQKLIELLEAKPSVQQIEAVIKNTRMFKEINLLLDQF